MSASSLGGPPAWSSSPDLDDPTVHAGDRGGVAPRLDAAPTASSNASATSRSPASRNSTRSVSRCRNPVLRAAASPPWLRDGAARHAGRRRGTARRRLRRPPARRRRRRRSASRGTSACARCAARATRRWASRSAGMTIPTVGFAGQDRTVDGGVRSSCNAVSAAASRARGGPTRSDEATDANRRPSVDSTRQRASHGT